MIFEGHPSWRAILGFYLKGIVIAALIALVAAGHETRRRADGGAGRR